MANLVRLLAAEGVGAVLDSLHPGIRWRPPTLYVDHPIEEDLDLGGSGLLIVPLVHARAWPTLAPHVEPQPVLLYPAVLPAVVEGRPAGPDPLVGVLGRTRALILRALRDADRTTSQLAHVVGVSPATASQGAAALRDAGLVATRRTGRSVRHRLTARGWQVVETGVPPATARTPPRYP